MNTTAAIVNWYATLHVAQNDTVTVSNRKMLIEAVKALPDGSRLYRVEFRESGESFDGTKRILLGMAQQFPEE